MTSQEKLQKCYFSSPRFLLKSKIAEISKSANIITFI